MKFVGTLGKPKHPAPASGTYVFYTSKQEFVAKLKQGQILPDCIDNEEPDIPVCWLLIRIED